MNDYDQRRMSAQDIIRRKRDGGTLSPDELRAFFDAYMRGEVPDYQATALLMATYFRGMSFDETIALTRIFLESGTRIDLSSIAGPTIDKHSTGGVGDKTSLLLVPICAAAGINAPMISGRGLGFTGGTLDKLESIPGFRTNLSEAEYLRVLAETGMAMAGQTDALVPLDRRIYALRDVTATVEILPFIGASIMSKKIAGGADALVLDVKCGSGAFMKSRDEARELALLLAAIGTAFGLRTEGVVTRMDEPLGRTAGNWIEVVEVVECLRGADVPDLMDVTYALAALMLRAGGAAATIAEGRALAEEMVRSGRAYEKFLTLVRAQGGDTRVIEETLRGPAPRHVADVYAGRSGMVAHIDALAIGRLAVALGAGRMRADDTVDPTAGIVLDVKTGDRVEEGDMLCRLHSSVHASLAGFRQDALRAFTITDAAPDPHPHIHDWFTDSTVMPWPEALAAEKG